MNSLSADPPQGIHPRPKKKKKKKTSALHGTSTGHIRSTSHPFGPQRPVDRVDPSLGSTGRPLGHCSDHGTLQPLQVPIDQLVHALPPSASARGGSFLAAWGHAERRGRKMVGEGQEPQHVRATGDSVFSDTAGCQGGPWAGHFPSDLI